MKKSLSLAALAISAAALLVASCTKKEAVNKDEIVLGHFASLTGETANFGQSTEKGLRLALDEYNAKGGFNGKPVRVVTYDDQSKPEEAQSTITKLITQDNVIGVIGEVASRLSLVAADVAMRNRTPMLSPSSTNPGVTQKGEYIFRICFIDPFQGEVMAKFARNQLKAKTAAVFRDVKQDYSVGLSNYFIKAFEAAGGKVVIDTSYQSGEFEFNAQLTEIKRKSPDVVFIPGYYNEVALIATQARKLGIKQPLLGGDGWESPDLFKIAGKAMDGTYYSTHYAPDTKETSAQDFIKNFKTKYNETPDAMAALGYDAFNVMMDALKRAKTVSREDLKSALAETKDYQGVTGKTTINSERNAVKSAVVLKLGNNEARYFTTVNP